MSNREIDKSIANVRTELGQVLTRQYHASQRLSTENKRHEEVSEFRFAQSTAATTATVKASSSTVHQRVADAEATFNRVVTRAGGIALGDKGVDPKFARAQAELEDLARQNRIKERLAALKKA